MEQAAPGPILITVDERLVDAVARAAAAAGVVPTVRRDARSALAGWAGSEVVLIGAERLEEVVELALPRRPQVHVVSTVPPEPAVLRDALRCGVTSVLHLPVDESRLVDLLTDIADGGTGTGKLIGVVGGTGGAGATTFAAALGSELARIGDAALLVDADASGGGIDQVLGLDSGEGVRWDALAQASGRLSGRSLRETLPVLGPLSVVSWPADRSAGLAATTLRSVLSAGRRGYPAVVVDLPRTGTTVLAEVLPQCDQVVVISTVTLPGLAACLQLREKLPAASTAAVLRGRGGFDAAAVERVLGMPVWQQMPDQRGLDEGISLGLGPLRARRGPLARAARQVAARLHGPTR